MVGPSGNWHGFIDLDPDSTHTTRISEVIRHADWSYLCEVALTSRRAAMTSDDPNLSCSVNLTDFTSGRNNVVFEIPFSDPVYWVARVRVFDDLGDAGVEKDMRSEVFTIRIIQERTNIPVATVFSFDCDPENKFGYRYLLMSALEGQSLEDGLAQPLQVDKIDKVASELAMVYHQLSKTHFEKIGRLNYTLDDKETGGTLAVISYTDPTGYPITPLTTSLEYFYRNRHALSREALADHAGEEEWESACWILGQALPDMVDHDYVNGPFPLCHMDLHYENILFDSDNNITGILDRSGAQTAPLARLAASPESITFPGLSEEENAPIIRFRNMVSEKLEPLESEARRSNPGSRCLPLSRFVGSRRAELVYRCDYTFPWRTLTDARMVAKLKYGDRLA